MTDEDLWIRVAVTIAGDAHDASTSPGPIRPAPATATARSPSPARPSTSWCAA